LSQKQFEKIKNEWEQKLQDSGFVDYEYQNGGFKQPHSCDFSKPRSLRIIFERQRYYEVASHLLEDHPFLVLTQTEEEIWQMYCEGKTTRQIAQIFRDQGRKLYKNRFYLDKDDVHKVIKELDSIVVTLCI
jgi:hypothetical protein